MTVLRSKHPWKEYGAMCLIKQMTSPTNLIYFSFMSDCQQKTTRSNCSRTPSRSPSPISQSNTKNTKKDINVKYACCFLFISYILVSVFADFFKSIDIFYIVGLVICFIILSKKYSKWQLFIVYVNEVIIIDDFEYFLCFLISEFILFILVILFKRIIDNCKHRKKNY